MRGGLPPRSGRAGFTLIELSISLAILLIALALASQLLMETSQLFAESSGESLDAPVPLLIARIRGDVQGSTSVEPVYDLIAHTLQSVDMQGFDGRISYEKMGVALYRTFTPADGSPPRTALLWPGVIGWGCERLQPKGLILLEVTYRRRSTPRTPLPTLPALRGPVMETLTQRMFLLPRGAGLGETW
jgi:prepilin-type N-terminal cleavage/methylation domain-containing protein